MSFHPYCVIAQIETAVKLVDQASTATDRWLFLAVLVILMFAGAMCIRWLVNSLHAKDAAYEAAAVAARTAHALERAEFRAALHTSSADFVAALNTMQAAFRQELSTERHECAQERTLDRDARHAMANALNGVSLVLAEHRETLLPSTPDGIVGRPKHIHTETQTKIS